jgi:tungstate transport system ATP-binding protein
MAEATLFPLEARRLCVRFAGHEALHDVNFALDGRERVVILGANGAGKSVLLRVLHGLIAPTSGEVHWAGEVVRPRAQAMVFQRPVMLRRPALANIAYALGIHGFDGAQRTRLAREALERVGLGAIASRQARVLSGGEQQRLALARAWALRPRIMFLDEPTASLDPAAAGEVERVIGEIHRAGTAIVMTTHNLGLARRVADDILFLHEGRLAERAAADTFFTAPKSSEAGAFLKGELPWTATHRTPSPA